ncbi:MAG: Gfo/Idh/MocA family oxidoreductase, partial [Planctomycetes bacterium]|nr:Gfo/Idh/MocA family oxidoreductase [Planctomycetota bacterium]
MNDNNRRSFLQQTGMGVAAAAVAGRATYAAAGANRRIVVGVIGPGGMGSNHLRSLVRLKDVEVAYVCDVDRNRLARAEKTVKDATGKSAKGTGDLRKVLGDPKVDAVFIATPDHWHAPAAILALDAGKHVYVEKPCCHNIREGRLMADAVKRSGKHLQVGTQTRSTEFVQDAMNRLHSGAIGEILVAKAWNSQRRRSIGKSKPTKPPATLDFDTWTGPVPRVPYRPNMLHSIWRWWHDFGCGDIGNDGVH